MKRDRLLELVNRLAKHRKKLRGNDVGVWHRAWTLATTSTAPDVPFAEEARLEELDQQYARRQQVKATEGQQSTPETTFEK